MKVRWGAAIAAMTMSLSLAQPADAQPAHEGRVVDKAGCQGADCDRLGPQSQGCIASARSIASTDGNALRLMYSTDCHAFYVKGHRFNFWDHDIQLEVQHLENPGCYEYWAAHTTVATRVEASQDPDSWDWTNMYGARNIDRWRFRGVVLDVLDPSHYPRYTPWAHGGGWKAKQSLTKDKC